MPLKTETLWTVFFPGGCYWRRTKHYLFYPVKQLWGLREHRERRHCDPYIDLAYALSRGGYQLTPRS